MLFLLPGSTTKLLNKLDLETTKASSVTTTNYMSCRGNSGTFIDAPSDLKVSQKPWILASYQRRFVRRLTIIRLRDSLNYSAASGTSSKIFGIWNILVVYIPSDGKRDRFMLLIPRHLLRPEGSIKCAVLDCLGDMLWLYSIRTLQIGNRPGNLQYAVVGARRQPLLRHRPLQQFLAISG